MSIAFSVLLVWLLLPLLGCVAPGAARFTVLDEAGVRVLADRLLPPLADDAPPLAKNDAPPPPGDGWLTTELVSILGLGVMYATNQYRKHLIRRGQ